jgi:hypothetical protein
MAHLEVANTSNQAGTDSSHIKQQRRLVTRQWLPGPLKLVQAVVLIVPVSLGIGGCNDLGTELVSDICTPKLLDIPENGYQLLNLNETCNIPADSFEAFRLDETENLELVGRAFDGNSLTVLFKSNGPLSGSADQQFTLKWIDPNGCNPTQSKVRNCRTHAYITVNPTTAQSQPEIQLIEIKESDRTTDGSPEQRDFTAIVEDEMKVVWVQEAIDRTVGIPQPAVPMDHSTHFGHWGNEPIGAMVSDADGVIGYASGMEADSTAIEVSLRCHPVCSQQLDGSYQVSLNRGDNLALTANAHGGVFGSYEGHRESHRYFWSGLHNASGQSNLQLEALSQSGAILLKVLDSVGNRGQAQLNISVDGVLAPKLAIRGTSQARPVADGGSINLGNDLLLDAVLSNPTGEYEVLWNALTTFSDLSPLGSGLSIQLQPSKPTTFRAQLVSNAVVVAVADFQLKVNTTIDYANLSVLQPGMDRGLIVSKPDGIQCGILDPDDSSNCRHAVQLGNLLTLNVDLADIERFQRWEGCDQLEDNLASGDRCVLVMDSERSVSAHFDKRTDYILKFTSVGPDGWVNAHDQHNEHQYIDCKTEPNGTSGICTARIPFGSKVYLSGTTRGATASFRQWGGDCSHFNEFGSQVGFIMERDYACTAEYAPDKDILFNYRVEGEPSQVVNPLRIGRVKTSSAGQHCGAGRDGCFIYPRETGLMQVTAVPDQAVQPWYFYQWRGDCAAEVVSRHNENLRYRDARTIMLEMGQDYTNCVAHFRTDVTRAVIDFNQPNPALIRKVDHATNTPSTADFNTCGDDCELVKLHEENFNAIMDLVVDQIDPHLQFDGWEGCDKVQKVPAWSPYPACRIGNDGHGLFPVRANFSLKGDDRLDS